MGLGTVRDRVDFRAHAEERRGVFRTLYRHLRRRVKKSPRLKGLRLFVDKSNRRAHKVYQALGMSKDHYHLYEWLDR